MTKDNLFPIEYGDSEIVDIISIQYYDSTFLEDFGVFEKGEKVYSLFADIDQGLLMEFGEDGEIVRSQTFKCIAED